MFIKVAGVNNCHGHAFPHIPTPLQQVSAAFFIGPEKAKTSLLFFATCIEHVNGVIWLIQMAHVFKLLKNTALKR